MGPRHRARPGDRQGRGRRPGVHGPSQGDPGAVLRLGAQVEQRRREEPGQHHLRHRREVVDERGLRAGVLLAQGPRLHGALRLNGLQESEKSVDPPSSSSYYPRASRGKGSSRLPWSCGTALDSPGRGSSRSAAVGSRPVRGNVKGGTDAARMAWRVKPLPSTAETPRVGRPGVSPGEVQPIERSACSVYRGADAGSPGITTTPVDSRARVQALALPPGYRSRAERSR